MLGVSFVTVLGCPDPPLPRGARLKRNGDLAEVDCGALLLWQLNCVGDEVNGYQWNNLPDVGVTCDNGNYMFGAYKPKI